MSASTVAAETPTLAPILAVPVELFAEIFFHAVPDFVDTLDSYRAPRLLMHVCTRWREIVLSTPRLWSSFRLDLGRKHSMEDVQTTIERAGILALSVHALLGNVRIENLEDSETKLGLLRRYAPRIRRLQVDTGMLHALHDALDCPSDRDGNGKGLKFSALKELLHWDDSVSYDLIRKHRLSPVSFATVYGLRRVRLCKIFSTCLRLPAAQISNIVDFEGLCGSPAELKLLLDDLPRLSVLSIELYLSEFPTTLPVIQHTEIRHLQLTLTGLRWYQANSELDIFMFLSLPALESINLDYRFPIHDDTFALLRDCSPHLSRLHFCPDNGFNEPAPALLRPLGASLQTLFMTRPTLEYLDSFLADLLGSSDGASGYLPQLAEIHVEDLDSTHLIPFLQLAGNEILKRRRGGVLPLQLRSLHVVALYPETYQKLVLPDKVAELLRELREGGMEIVVVLRTRYDGTGDHSVHF
ncbi:hypothetical protein MKEN_00124700 [Mycena kentingensis (nom. inval.)]|nr:hypothetical protein MKEN_00124700 [Mycena kentingensis (nom. inval.)]